MRTLFLLGLLLISVSAYAQNKPAISHAEGVRLTGLEDPATTKVYVVQLRSPSAGEYHATLTKSNAMSSSSAAKARPRLQKDSAAIKSYTARLDGEQRAVMSKAGPGTDQTPLGQMGRDERRQHGKVIAQTLEVTPARLSKRLVRNAKLMFEPGNMSRSQVLRGQGILNFMTRNQYRVPIVQKALVGQRALTQDFGAPAPAVG